ncbi:glucose-1-phosphate adenylyltransferase isoform X1 [Callorhinchus milii]|uniref:Zgc:136439 n=1 Tax=Callorhinchus milii TaxID=7868 RepID=A0A4W3J8E9_CALMI|nr:glucose-1-phosphate adenylyltransferase isoform X1 [Callorhinchus milii]|eukprot:gi/632945971/ref/XP_007888325.1/ PREDICTED: mannose-1-phosphate guanylyltransferase 1-like isoform X2 [Callorhinchus milii]
MKAIILAAGYGTRLNRDLQSQTTVELRPLLGTPKPLLPVGPRPLISHWMAAVEEDGGAIDAVYVVTNDLYYERFQDWAKEFKLVQVLNDGTRRNEERLGAIACLQLAIDKFNINDHILVIGGDTLFYDDFSLSDVITKFVELQKTNCDSNLVLSYLCKDEETTKFGILEVDENFKVTAFKEKPSSTQTTSRRACPCFYVYSKNTIPLIAKFLQEKQNTPLEEKDAPGNFLSWVHTRKPVFAQHISGRFDVGNLPSYIDCNKYFQKRQDTTA